MGESIASPYRKTAQLSGFSWVDAQCACGTVHQPTWWTIAEDVRTWLLSGEDLWIPDLSHSTIEEIVADYDLLV